MSLIKTSVIESVKKSKNIVIVPECFNETEPNSSTSSEAIEEVLSFILPFAKQQVIIAGSIDNGKTLTAFNNFGYLELQNRYDLGIVDLKNDAFETIELLGNTGKKTLAKVARTLIDSDCIISIATPKLSSRFKLTGNIINISKNALLYPDENPMDRLIKKNYRHYLELKNEISAHNIKTIISNLNIGPAIIDGYETLDLDKQMMIPTQFAIASSDFSYSDLLLGSILKLEPEDIFYLQPFKLLKIDNLFVAGDDCRN